MKIRNFIILLAILFMAVMFLGKLRMGMEGDSHFAWTRSWAWAMSVAGGTISAVSALVLLQRAIAGTTLQQVIPSVVALFGGLLVYQSEWALAVGLAVVMVGWVIAERWGKGSGKDSNPSV